MIIYCGSVLEYWHKDKRCQYSSTHPSSANTHICTYTHSHTCCGGSGITCNIDGVLMARGKYECVWFFCTITVLCAVHDPEHTQTEIHFTALTKSFTNAPVSKCLLKYCIFECFLNACMCGCAHTLGWDLQGQALWQWYAECGAFCWFGDHFSACAFSVCFHCWDTESDHLHHHHHLPRLDAQLLVDSTESRLHFPSPPSVIGKKR